MIVLDTSVVVGYMNGGDDDHAAVLAWLDSEPDELVTTPLAVAEMDYFALEHLGTGAARALRESLVEGAYTVEWWDGAVEAAAAIADQHEQMRLGLTDASLVALAARLGTTRVATLDERHFRALRPLTGEQAFVLLPADA